MLSLPAIILGDLWKVAQSLDRSTHPSTVWPVAAEGMGSGAKRSSGYGGGKEGAHALGRSASLEPGAKATSAPAAATVT